MHYRVIRKEFSLSGFYTQNIEVWLEEKYQEGWVLVSAVREGGGGTTWIFINNV